MTASKKNDIVVIILSFVFFIIQISCESAGIHTTDIDVQIKNTETYTHNLGNMGGEECISIYIDAKHAFSSKILGEPWMEPRIYEYIPDSNYVGPDRTVIRIQKCPETNKSGVILEINYNFQIVE